MPPFVYPRQLFQLLQENPSLVYVVDVREAFEYRREHLENAHWFPFSSFDPAQVLDAMEADALPAGADLYVICATGGRSNAAAVLLHDEIVRRSQPHKMKTANSASSSNAMKGTTNTQKHKSDTASRTKELLLQTPSGCAVGHPADVHSLKEGRGPASERQGRPLVFNVAGGLYAWKVAHLPIVENRRAALPLVQQVNLFTGFFVVSGVLLGRFRHPSWYTLSTGAGAVLLSAAAFCEDLMRVVQIFKRTPKPRTAEGSESMKK